MAFDIHEHARSAQAALHEALAELERARTAYATGAGPRFAQAKAAQAALAAKIEAAEGYRALQEGGEQLARAMALAANAPRSDSLHEDALGRPASTQAMRAEIAAARWAFILDGLKAMAEGLPEYSARPQVQALGVFELGALQAQDVLTPVQIHLMRKAGRVAP